MSALSAARADTAAAVSALALPGVTVLAYEPPTLGAGTTVTVSSAAVTATELQLAVRVYASGMQAAEAADAVDDTVQAVDDALDAPRPGAWTFDYDAGKQAFVAATTINVPREDF